jgi:sec-independent protein translocase protein TatB
MLNLSPEKLLLVGMIALVVLGPNRLPQAARTLGRWVAELRRLSSGFEEEVRGAIGEPAEALRSAVQEFRPPDVGRTVRRAIHENITPRPPSRTPDPSGLPLNPDDPSLN